MVAAIGRAADVIGCSRITFSAMSTQVLKRVVIEIVYQREMPRRSIEVNIMLSRRRARRKYLKVVVKELYVFNAFEKYMVETFT
jgi:hypothetical protein